MKNIACLMVLLLSYSGISLSAQEVEIKGSVVDQNRQPLAYVNIGVVGTRIGTVTDVDGTFTLFLDETITPSDTIRFSMVGFGHRDFRYENLKGYCEGEPLDVTLKEQPIVLQEAIIKPQFDNLDKIGMTKVDTKRSVNFSISALPAQNLGAEIGRHFRVKGRPTFIENVRFFLKYNDFEETRFRVNVYAIDQGKPGAHLLNKSVIKEVVDQQTGWIEVNLAPYNIISAQDVIVTVEWVYHSDKGRYLSIPIKFPVLGGNHVYKFGSQNDWKRFRNMSAAMELTVSY